MHIEFEAFEYTADGTLQPTRLAFDGDQHDGWSVLRNGVYHLTLGPGYRLVRSLMCGVCSTDLARRFLPFPLPQVTGHEVIATDQSGERFAVDINASHHAREIENNCPFCLAGLSHHCPDRLVLGINGLPGGFGAWFLAPVGALRAIPADMPIENAVLVEPLAAALHAVRSLSIKAGDRVAVLGPRKLGMLMIAALRSERERLDTTFEIIALARRPELLALAKELGADSCLDVGETIPDSSFEIVIDCTGSANGFETALSAATREVHLKSTNGQPAGGLDHMTEFVVDELAMELFTEQNVRSVSLSDQRDTLVVGWVCDEEPPDWLANTTDLIRAENAVGLSEIIEKEPLPGLPRVDAIVVDSPSRLVEAIRLPGAAESSTVRPTGTILYAGPLPADVSLLTNLIQKYLRLSSSRCGDFDEAIALLSSDPQLSKLGERMITHRFQAEDLPAAFETASSHDCLKAIVIHP